MNILALSHIFPPAIDGGSKVIYKLGQYLQSQGHQVVYLSSNCRSTDDFVNPKSKIMSPAPFRLPVYRTWHRPLKLINLTLAKGPIFKTFPLVKALVKIIKFKPRLIIAGPLPTTIILYAHLIKKLTKAKILVNASFHQTDPAFSQPLTIKALQKADFIWSLTKHETDFFINNLNINPLKIINIGNGVDQKFLIQPSKISFPRRPCILYIGAFAKHKNIEKLIRLFIRLRQKYPDLTLTLAGQKTLYWPQIQKKLPPTKNIKIIFNFKNRQLAKLIDSCTFVCLPSKQESFGLVLIEAMARGKPVVVNPIPPLKELIRQTQGGLPLSQIEQLLGHPQLCRRLGLNGHTYVKNHYTWDKIGKTIWQKLSPSLS